MNGGGKPPAAGYRPYRFSELGTAPDGKRVVFMRANNPDPNGPTIGELRASGNTVRPNEVRAWLLRLSVEPDDRELSELTEALNTMRVTKPREEAVAMPPELDRVATALAALAADVPVLADMQRAIILGAPPDAVATDLQRRASLVLELNKLSTIVRALQADPFFKPPAPRKRTALWHRDLQLLAFLLQRMGEKRELEISLTKAEGAGVEFLRTALARVGIHHDRQAIAKEMVRARKDQLREISLTPPR
jgi:hypothetical protein